MLPSEQRQRLRRVLAGTECIHPASVFDPVSARMAESLGWEIAMLGGTVASATVLGAPDLVVLTLTELAQQVRRITRASSLSLIVDGDHGYGNALNVMRTVEELEAVGVSGLTIEDMVLPKPFGDQAGGEVPMGRILQGEGLVSVPEMVGKLRGALEARQDPSLVIIGRTDALLHDGIPEAEKRVKAYQETGIDAVFLLGVSTQEELKAMHRACTLPLLMSAAPPSLGGRELLAANGVRVALQIPLPFYVAARAVYDTMKHLKEGGSPEELSGATASEDQMATALRRGDYARWQREYLS